MRALVAALALTGCLAVGDEQLDTTTSELTTQRATGQISTIYRPDVNRCVPDVPAALRKLRTNGDVIGYRMAQSYPGMASCLSTSYLEHWQSVQRVPPRYYSSCQPGGFCTEHNSYGRTNYLVADSGHEFRDSLDDPSTFDDGAHLATVYMGSRAGTAGRRYGPSRTDATYADGNEDWTNPPPSSDRIVRNTQLDADTSWNHPGGMQFLGNYLFVGLEGFRMSCPSNIGNVSYASKIVALDFAGLPDAWQSSSWTPSPVNTWWRDGADASDPLYVSTQAVAATKLAPFGGSQARYLLVTANGNDPSWSFYTSQPGATLATADFDEVFKTELESLGVNGYNNLNLLTQCDGELYLVGMNGGEYEDDQYMDAWHLAIAYTVELGSWTVSLDRVDLDPAGPTFQRHFNCLPHNAPPLSRQCDFVAAAGTYVDPEGRVLLYSTAWFDSHDLGADHVRMMEFRPEDLLDNPSTPTVEGCTSIANAWAELFQYNLGSGGSPGIVNRSLLVEARRANARAVYGGVGHANLDYAYNFNDTTQSIRYCAPTGYHVALFANHQHAGSVQTYAGTGALAWSNSPSATASSICFRRNGSTGCCTESAGAVACP